MTPPTRFRLIGDLAAMVILAALVVAAWQLIAVALELPRLLLPTPAVVFIAAKDNLSLLATGFLITAASSLAGLAISILVGTLVALLFSQSRLIRAAGFPYVVFLQTVPIVAIAPLLTIWLGYGTQTVIVTSAIISLFPIISGTTAGLLAVEPHLLDLFRLLGANRWAILWKLRVPTAVPYLLLSIRVSSGLAVIGAIVGEFFVGGGSTHQGLGALMISMQRLYRTDVLLAALAASTLLGLVLFGTISIASPLIVNRFKLPDRSDS